MIGLGGWGGRSEKDGPYVYWKDGQIVRDMTPGPGGEHGTQHPFQIVVRDQGTSHYQGPAREVHALRRRVVRQAPRTGKEFHRVGHGVFRSGRARQRTSRAGADGHRLWQGRVFNTTLGHESGQLRSVAFIVTFPLARSGQPPAT